MRPPIFYAANDQKDGDQVTLDATESRHALKVMRLRKGDAMVVVDQHSTLPQ